MKRAASWSSARSRSSRLASETAGSLGVAMRPCARRSRERGDLVGFVYVEHGGVGLAAFEVAPSDVRLDAEVVRTATRVLELSRRAAPRRAGRQRVTTNAAVFGPTRLPAVSRALTASR